MSAYTVLVVEDEAPLRRNLARTVTACGYTTVVAENGSEACDMLQEGTIDIVLSDLYMPSLDGFGLLKWMRDNDYLQPVIVISGNGMVESAITALRLGAYDYLIKPFEKEDVAAALRRAESSVIARRANQALGQRNRELAALTAISAAGSSTLDLNQMLQETIPATMDVLGVNGAAVYLGNDAGEFELANSYGQLHLSPSWLPRTLHITNNLRTRIGPKAVAEVLSAACAEFDTIPVGESLEALFTLQARGNVCGVVVLTHSVAAPITPDQTDLLHSIGNIIGVGVANAQMYGAVYTSAILLEEQVALRTRELQRSRDLLRTTFDGIPNGLVLIDHLGNVLAANRACADLLGHPLQYVVGSSYSALWPQEHVAETRATLQRCMTRGEPIYRRARLEYAGRSPIVLDCYLFPVQGVVSSEPIQIIEYLDNVTERLALEQMMAQTEQLAALGKLAATVAHEVNTPLLAIRGCVSLAADATDRETFQEYLGLAQGELDRAASIIRGLLDFYRPTGNERVGTNLNSLVSQVLQLLHAECLHNNVDVTKNLNENLPDIFGSPDQLKQVLLNLVLNAIEAMSAGGQLFVNTFSVPAPDHHDDIQSYAVVEVCDTGSGIRDEIIDRLFDAFVTTKDDGNGLGLAVCRNIVRDHGGTITASNRPEGGACFTVKLPVVRIVDHNKHFFADIQLSDRVAAYGERL